MSVGANNYIILYLDRLFYGFVNQLITGGAPLLYGYNYNGRSLEKAIFPHRSFDDLAITKGEFPW